MKQEELLYAAILCKIEQYVTSKSTEVPPQTTKQYEKTLQKPNLQKL